LRCVKLLLLVRPYGFRIATDEEWLMNDSLTQLLVHMDATPLAARRLEAACRIAQEHGAAVTALYAVTSAVAPLRDIDDERRKAARARFDHVAATAAVQPAWAEVRDDPVMPVFSQQALYADLLVLGQQDPGGIAASGVAGDFAESVMAASGKPALILPYAATPDRIGQTVAIAWKPTREAARAVTAALPLLQRAKHVHVVSWTAPDEPVNGVRLDLQGYLQRHGVQSVWHGQGDEPEAVGELLLSRVFDLEADLLVMGCYGHNRAREWALGGASRTILKSMTLPVLMAH
jgi:nucleotide-binding universal stress UspA family protein